MRPLYVLLAGFGFLLGLPISAALLIWDRATTTPKRINYAYVGGDNGNTPLDALAGALLAAPIVGALLGLLAAAILARFGWKLSRG